MIRTAVVVIRTCGDTTTAVASGLPVVVPLTERYGQWAGNLLHSVKQDAHELWRRGVLIRDKSLLTADVSGASITHGAHGLGAKTGMGKCMMNSQKVLSLIASGGVALSLLSVGNAAYAELPPALGASTAVPTTAHSATEIERERSLRQAPSGSDEAIVAEALATSPSDAELRGASMAVLVKRLVRCVATGPSGWYCLQIGMMSKSPGQGDFWREVRERASQPSSLTGDMSLGDRLRALAAMSRSERVTEERTEISSALQSIPTSTKPELARDGIPRSHFLFPTKGAQRQVKSYYCGPATLQMLDGNDPADNNGFDSQYSWASDLHTESQHATWIGDMVAQINSKTSWSKSYRGGRYVIMSMHGWDRKRYWSEIRSRVGYFNAPYAEHPKLAGKWYPYLSTNGTYGGHFQMGRGYAVGPKGTGFVHVFEAYNEPDWTGYSKSTWGSRKTTLYGAYYANLANQANIGI